MSLFAGRSWAIWGILLSVMITSASVVWACEGKCEAQAKARAPASVGATVPGPKNPVTLNPSWYTRVEALAPRERVAKELGPVRIKAQEAPSAAQGGDAFQKRTYLRN